MCKDCYQRERCLEREQFGRCSEYRSIEAIRNEVQAVMQSAKSSTAVPAEDGRVRQDEGDGGNQKATERVFLEAEVSEADKNEEGEIEAGWYSYFRSSTVNCVVSGRHSVVHKSGSRTGSHADTQAGRADDHSG